MKALLGAEVVLAGVVFLLGSWVVAQLVAPMIHPVPEDVPGVGDYAWVLVHTNRVVLENMGAPAGAVVRVRFADGDTIALGWPPFGGVVESGRFGRLTVEK